MKSNLIKRCWFVTDHLLSSWNSNFSAAFCWNRNKLRAAANFHSVKEVLVEFKQQQVSTNALSSSAVPYFCATVDPEELHFCRLRGEIKASSFHEKSAAAFGRQLHPCDVYRGDTALPLWLRNLKYIRQVHNAHQHAWCMNKWNISWVPSFLQQPCRTTASSQRPCFEFIPPLWFCLWYSSETA